MADIADRNVAEGRNAGAAAGDAMCFLAFRDANPSCRAAGFPLLALSLVVRLPCFSVPPFPRSLPFRFLFRFSE